MLIRDRRRRVTVQACKQRTVLWGRIFRQEFHRDIRWRGRLRQAFGLAVAHRPSEQAPVPHATRGRERYQQRPTHPVHHKQRDCSQELPGIVPAPLPPVPARSRRRDPARARARRPLLPWYCTTGVRRY
eukprot:COSAG02_NODE_898_length_16108_cov_5.877444_11_plen_129_part_00